MHLAAIRQGGGLRDAARRGQVLRGRDAEFLEDAEKILFDGVFADTLRADAGCAARKRIEEHYLWPKITKEIEAAYLEMLGRTPDTTSVTVGDEISA